MRNHVDGNAGTRKAIIVLLVCTAIGSAGIMVLQHYRPALHDWILSEPETGRVSFVLLLLAIFLSVPLLGAAAYVWGLGNKPAMDEAADISTARNAIGGPHLWRAMAIFLILVAGGVLVTLWQLSLLFLGSAR